MVYCSKCGTKNDDDVKICSNCGAALYLTGERPEYYRRMEHECFGIPGGGVIVGLAIGLIILIAGAILILQQANLISPSLEVGSLVWPLVLIVIGILMIIGVSYRRRRY